MNTSNSVSEVTRHGILDELRLSGLKWHGELGDIDFLSRLYELDELPSNDYRFPNAREDIMKHRVQYMDWKDDWIFEDARFKLLNGSDGEFLNFLCMMMNPVVRRYTEEVNQLLEIFNRHLSSDGCQLNANGQISGKPVFTAFRSAASHATALDSTRRVAQVVDSAYITQQIKRMNDSIECDPELAIGSAKEFVETICRTILKERNTIDTNKVDFPKLVHNTIHALDLVPQNVTNRDDAEKTVRKLLANLGSISQSLAELRNPYGTGHGKTADSKGLGPLHARLAVGAATTLAVFLYYTHLQSKE